MFEYISNKIDVNKNNFIIKKNISLEVNLNCFIHISSESKNYADALLNNILDSTIDKISVNNTYGDFSNVLENINAYIKTWNEKKDTPDKINVIIAILNENSLVFSNIGRSTAYMINKKNEFIHLTENNDHAQSFSYISNGTLQHNEIVTLSSSELLQYVTQSDIIDGLDNKKNLNHYITNIEQLLKGEIISENIVFSGFQYSNPGLEDIPEENKYIKYCEEKSLLLLDTVFMKKSLFFCSKGVDYMKNQSKQVKNVLLLAGIIIGIYFLYTTLSNIVSVATNDQEKEQNVDKLEQAKNYIRLAGENVANPNAFAKHILDAENIIEEVYKEKIFLQDIEKMKKNIHILKRQFNKIEIFETNTNNQIYTGGFENFVKIVNINLKPYIIEKKSITGPIINGLKGKKYINTNLAKDEFFVDADIIGSNIYLNTNKSNIVRFAKTGHFSYIDVTGQDKWEANKEIDSFGNNIYLVDKDKAQIYKHALSGKSFSKAKPYLKEDDVIAIKNIISVAIDGGFYLLKDDLMIQKFFSAPNYEMVNIRLDNVPKNYKIEKTEEKIEIKTRKDLDYVYILLNNKIFVFRPNTKKVHDVKFLSYIGQIEGSTNKILDFYVHHDGQIWVITDTGIYDLNIEISDESLIIK
ncbi:MAG: hypothetical protein GY828_06845 [Candidatus Gracilibacteria bacterium]|nr:hypothetical protein [Candidatus Gracilibacteria bacterium]